MKAISSLPLLLLSIAAIACTAAAPPASPRPSAPTSPTNPRVSPSAPPASPSTKPPSTAPQSPSAADPATLDGRSFLSVRVTEGTEERPLIDGTRIRISFTGGRISVNGGCNTMGGAYSLDATGVLTLVDAAVTEMACQGGLMNQDTWLFGFLGSQPTVSLSGNDLVIADDFTSIDMLDTEIAEPDLPLAGATWTLTSIISGDSVSSVPMDVVATLAFAEDGGVDVQPGCNSGHGTVLVGDGVMTFSDIALTRMACQGPAMGVEDAVLQILSADEVSYRIDSNVLTLMVGGNGLQFTGTNASDV